MIRNLLRRHALALAAGIAMSVLPAVSHAEFPEHPVKLVVPYTPGGPASLLARYLGNKLYQVMGQPVVIENKPGAGLIVGAQYVAGSAPDGYTLLVAASSMLVPTGSAARTPADNLKDFIPITLVGGFPLALITTTQIEATTVKDLIAYAKAHQGQLNYGSSGNGSLTHLAAALFAQQAGLNMVHVPFRGITESLVDLAAGRVQIVFAGAPSALPLVAGGKVRVMAVTSLQRSAAAPQLPSIAEAAIPGYEVMPWYGIVAPARTPAAVVSRLYRELTTIMHAPETREQWKEWGADPIYSKSSEEFAALMQKEAAKWAAFIKQTGIKVE